MELFADTSYPEGTYSFNASVYTHRRLVGFAHGALSRGPAKLLFYPLYNFPKAVVDALELRARTSSTPLPAIAIPRFDALELTDEFGSPDRMPFKPYIRSGPNASAGPNSCLPTTSSGSSSTWTSSPRGAFFPMAVVAPGGRRSAWSWPQCSASTAKTGSVSRVPSRQRRILHCHLARHLRRLARSLQGAE